MEARGDLCYAHARVRSGTLAGGEFSPRNRQPLCYTALISEPARILPTTKPLPYFPGALPGRLRRLPNK